MGSTVVALLARDGCFAVLWVGAMWAGGFFDREERVEVQRLVAKALGRDA